MAAESKRPFVLIEVQLLSGKFERKGRWKGGVVGDYNGDSQGGVKERQGFEESVWSFQSTEGALYRAQTRQNGKGGRGSREDNNVWFIDRECGSNVDKQ